MSAPVSRFVILAVAIFAAGLQCDRAHAQSLLNVASRTAESLANRAADAVLTGPVSWIEGLPLGAVLHGVVDAAGASAVQGESVDWTRAVAGSAATTVLTAVVAPEGFVAGVALDVAGGIVADKAIDLVAAYPGALTEYALGLGRAAAAPRSANRSPDGVPNCFSYSDGIRRIPLPCGSSIASPRAAAGSATR